MLDDVVPADDKVRQIQRACGSIRASFALVTAGAPPCCAATALRRVVLGSLTSHLSCCDQLLQVVEVVVPAITHNACAVQSMQHRCHTRGRHAREVLECSSDYQHTDPLGP